jgi:hypothetical protein
VLDLVEDHETPKGLEGKHGFIESGEIARNFEVEECDRTSALLDHLSCKGRLSNLPRAEEQDDTLLPE